MAPRLAELLLSLLLPLMLLLLLRLPPVLLLLVKVLDDSNVATRSEGGAAALWAADVPGDSCPADCSGNSLVKARLALPVRERAERDAAAWLPCATAFATVSGNVGGTCVGPVTCGGSSTVSSLSLKAVGSRVTCTSAVTATSQRLLASCSGAPRLAGGIGRRLASARKNKELHT